MATITCTVQRSAWYEMYIEYSYTQDISKNQSTISHSLKLKQLTDTYDFNGKMTVDYTVAGEKFSYSDTVNIDDKGNKGYTKTIMSGTTIVTHNNDGTKKIEFSCSGECVSGGYGPGTISLSSTKVTLRTIPRASSITSVSSNNVTLGRDCSVKWTPNSSTLKYMVKFSLGSWSYTTESFIKPPSTSEYTYNYTIPLDVAKQLPNATTGTMTVYLYTYSGSTKIGSTASKTFTVTVPSSIKPSISIVTAELVNSNKVIKGWGIPVAGYTKVKVSASASGSYSSTISSFTISGGYSKTQTGTSLAYTGGVITSSGNKTFTVMAKDSRGRLSTSLTTDNIEFCAYSKPTVSSFTVARSSSNTKNVVVKAIWDYSPVNSKNSATATLSYKKSSNTKWTTYGTIPNNTETTLTTEFEETSSYNFKVVVTDSLSNSAQEERFISTINVTMDFKNGGRGIGIGKMAEKEECLEIAFNTIFMGDVYIQAEDGTQVSLADYIKNLIT